MPALSALDPASKAPRENAHGRGGAASMVCAGRVRRGGSPPGQLPARAKIFELDELSTDALPASACLSRPYQAIEIDGDP